MIGFLLPESLNHTSGHCWWFSHYPVAERPLLELFEVLQHQLHICRLRSSELCGGSCPVTALSVAVYEQNLSGHPVDASPGCLH